MQKTARKAPAAEPAAKPAAAPGPRCGWPGSGCKVTAPAHNPEPGHRDLWTYHTTQCQIPNPDPGPHLDGYPVCCMATGHDGGCCYRRHVMNDSPNDHRYY